MEFSSLYINNENLQFHSIGIRLEEVEDQEKVLISFDQNTCSLNLFGDKVQCTKMAPLRFESKLVRIRLADPLNLDRKIYNIPQEVFTHNIWLINFTNDLYIVIEKDKNGNGDIRDVLAVIPLIKINKEKKMKSKVDYFVCFNSIIFESKKDMDTALIIATGYSNSNEQPIFKAVNNEDLEFYFNETDVIKGIKYFTVCVEIENPSRSCSVKLENKTKQIQINKKDFISTEKNETGLWILGKSMES